MDRRKGKGKMSETSIYDNSAKKEAEWKKLQAELQRECEQSWFKKRMKIFKSREERKGKDWVKTKEEMFNFDFYNDDLATQFVATRQKLDADLKDRKISEEEWYRLVEQQAALIDQKYEELLDVEEVEFAKYVETRKRQFPPEN